MPKQIIEINPFHGGMNNNTDPRDLQHDELASAEDVMVDKIGRIRTGPAVSSHASASPPFVIDDLSDRSGTSLFAFSHDYKLAGKLDNILKNGFSNQNAANSWDGDGNTQSFWVSTATHFQLDSSVQGSVVLSQTSSNRIHQGFPLKRYKFTYTISNYTLSSGSAPELKILSGDGHFAADASYQQQGGSDEIFLNVSNGTHSITITSDQYVTDAPFEISATNNQIYSLRLDNLKLEYVSEVDNIDEGEDYLLLYQNTSANNYGFGIYSYGEDDWMINDAIPNFGTITGAANPVFSYVDGVVRIVDGLKGTNANKIWYSYIDRFRWGTSTVFCTKWLSCSSVISPPIDADIVLHTSQSQNTYTPDEGKFVIVNPYGFTTNVSKSGTWNPNGVSATSSGSGNGLRILVGPSNTFTSNMVGLKVKQGNTTSIITGYESETIVHTESGTWSNNTSFNVYEEYDIGFSWMYDGNQESLIHNRTSAAVTDKDNWSFKIDDFRIGHEWDSATTGRKTGIQMYYRKNSDISQTWYHLGEFDLNKGFRKSDEEDFSKTWVQVTSTTEYKIINIYIHNPPVLETYESKNGYKNDVNALLDFSDPDNDGMGYSVSTIANRVHYIANVRYKDKNGKTRNHDDVMFKSIVNKFDTFPISRKIEVTVQDGDKITALASYADRLLQYKKNKMHLINISQEVEFLEDTFKFKGVESQAAVCETDFGIAWVNQFGCYLYDGRQVNNLLEQKGVRKISESSWLDSSHKPMIAYSPKQRQLIIAKDHSGKNTNTGNGNAWIYDMVTKSWVLQAGSFIVNTLKHTSNFVTDHLGDVVYSIETGSMKTINTSSSEAKSNIKIITADMNYGDSGVRKKVYRVRLSYKGDASSLNVRYSTNGDTNTYKQFEGTSSGLPNGSATNTPLENKSSDVTQWHHAELKPAVSSEATNIYSFQVHMTGTAGVTFEINDLSVVFRVKNVK